ncbi:MAG: peptide chain release factor-like protein [Fuerstiella sp.]|nr:peptide chain release factor-like protein [Fuerstiella sp.]
MDHREDIRYPAHPVTLSNDTLLRECLIRRFRASGPGGQHRNKVETGVELIHESTGVSAVATERRSQADNQRAALQRLRLRLAVEVRLVFSPAVYPSVLWKSRCRNRKIQCSERHADFPVLITESLNAVHAKDYDVKSAADALGCTTSQLVRFIARVPEALIRVNTERNARGLRSLKG